jgi:Arc/MetJ-type ribon-helix-helix transcriptional regulator
MTAVNIELPAAMHTRIGEIIRETRMFESHEDFIMHAVTDILEKYGGNKNANSTIN